MDIVSLILIALLAYSITHFILGFWSAYKSLETEVNETVKKQLSEKIHVVKEEQHGDHTYWFDLETDKFLAQGPTNADIIEILKNQFLIFCHWFDVLKHEI